jgi:hypothetical protein
MPYFLVLHFIIVIILGEKYRLDRLCGLVARGCRSRVPGSILGATSYSEK